MSNIASVIFTFQDAIDASANGEVLSINANSQTMNVEIESTSTDAIVNFEAQIVSNSWQTINGVNLANFSVMSSPQASDSIFQIDLTGVRNIRCRVSDMTNGAVTVSGRVVG